jgi:LPS export ABC transporter protein LptC
MHMAAVLAAILTYAFVPFIVMKINGKLLMMLSVFLVLFAIFYGGYLWLRGADMTMPSLFRPAPGARRLMSMQGFRFTQSEQGRISWRMQAREADLYENKEARLKDLEITFFSPDKREGVLIGEAGTMDTVTGNASISRVSREVRVVTSDGYLLTTNSLFWKAGERLVRTPDPFKLLGSEIYLEGKGLSANLGLRTIMVNSNVKAVLQE